LSGNRLVGCGMREARSAASGLADAGCWLTRDRLFWRDTRRSRRGTHLAFLPSRFRNESGGCTDLTPNDGDVLTLRWFLHDYLPQLQREAARTDSKEIRHVLVTRLTLCQRLMEQLGGSPYLASSLSDDQHG
jgi:hypothetical protein